MSIRTKRNSRRFIAAAAAVAVAASTFATTSGPVGASSVVTVSRVAGLDRYGTSIEISKATFPVGGATTHVILASGTSEVDGLAASALAGRRSAPVLLIPPTGAVSAALAAEITRLGATNVIIVGGNAAVAAAAETNLAATGRTITRISGADRYETAANVATEGVAAANVGNFPGTTRKAVIIARGDNAADALAASGVAYAGKHPVLLTRSGSLDASAAAAITALGATQAVIMGGTAAVSDAVKTAVEALGVTTVRVSGADRAATATALADVAVTAFGFTRAVPMLVSGSSFADALSASSHSGTEKRAMLYASAPGQAGLPTATATYLSTNANTITTIVAIGGVAAVPAAVAAAAKAEAQKVSLAAPSVTGFSIISAPTLAAPTTPLVVEFTFTGGITTTMGTAIALNPGKFGLVTYQGGTAEDASAAVRMSDTTVRAQWTMASNPANQAAFADATAVTVGGAVYTVATRPSVQAFFPLKAVNVGDFNSARITNVVASASTSASHTTFTVSVASAENLTTNNLPTISAATEFVLRNGTPIVADAANDANVAAVRLVNTTSFAVDMITAPTLSAVTSFATIHSAAAAVSNSALVTGVVGTNSLAGAVRLNPAGLSNGANVTGVTVTDLAAGGSRITATFSAPVTVSGTIFVSTASAKGTAAVEVASAAGALVTPVGGASTTATWNVAGIDRRYITRVHIPGAVGFLADPNKTGNGANAPQSFYFTNSFAAGEILGPNVTAVSVTPVANPMSPTGAVGSYTVTLTFNKLVNRGDQTLVTVNANGLRETLTAVPVVTPSATLFAGATTLTVSVTATADVAKLLSAVQIGVTAGLGVSFHGGASNIEVLVPKG